VASTLLAGGLLMMKSRSEALPAATGRGTLRALVAWIRDPTWLGGLFIQALGYALYIAALSGAPVSIVAVMMQGGIALFVLFAVVILGERAAAREWLGIGAILAGMALLAVSLPAGEDVGALDPRALLALSVVLVAMSLVPMGAQRLKRNGAAAAIFSGIAFGLGGLFTKAMTDDFMAREGVAIALRIASNPYVYLACVANTVGIIMLQNSFHDARGIIAMPLSSALSNLVPIAGGMIAFGERLPAQHLAAALRIAAFALTIVAGGLLAGSRASSALAHSQPLVT
jgi:drug/metabolite transporter (DMT)-like permease